MLGLQMCGKIHLYQERSFSGKKKLRLTFLKKQNKVFALCMPCIALHWEWQELWTIWSILCVSTPQNASFYIQAHLSNLIQPLGCMLGCIHDLLTVICSEGSNRSMLAIFLPEDICLVDPDISCLSFQTNCGSFTLENGPIGFLVQGAMWRTTIALTFNSHEQFFSKTVESPNFF